MANHTSTVDHRSIGWSGIAIGAGLTIAFTFVADLLGTALGSPVAAAVLAAISLFLAGVATVRVRTTAHSLEPAIGAALVVLLFSVARIALLRDEPLPMPPAQIGIALVMGVLMAFVLAWSGGRVGHRFGARLDRPPPDRNT